MLSSLGASLVIVSERLAKVWELTMYLLFGVELRNVSTRLSEIEAVIARMTVPPAVVSVTKQVLQVNIRELRC